MPRTVGTHEIIDAFSGVNDLVDQVKLPKDKVGWVHGMYPSDQKAMVRIPGKLLMGTSTSPGRILTIQQLSFDEVDVVVRHTSTLLITNNSMSLLNSSSSSVSPLAGFMAP